MTIDSDLLQALIKYDFSACEYKIIFIILNSSRNCNNTIEVNLDNFISATGLGKTYISKVLNDLRDRNIIYRDRRRIKFNTDFNKWKTKMDKLKIKKKVLSASPKFYQFYNSYPKNRRFGFSKTLELWNEINPDGNLADYIISQVIKFQTSKEWTTDNGKYIPACYNFLRDKRWGQEMTYPKPDWRDM